MWFDGKFVADADAHVSLLSHSLHYGGAVYEGIRFYQTADGRKAVFRLQDHLVRLHQSAQVMGMEMYPMKVLEDVIVQAVRMSSYEEGYIRPMVFRGEGIGLMASNISVHTMIAILPWAKGQESIRLVTSPIVRLHPGSTNIEVKVAGHYVNSYLAAAEARKRDADDALLLDWQGYVAETSVANVFFLKGNRIFTPKRGSIFPGITRDTTMSLLAASGQIVEERNLSLSQAMFCDAMFLAGTACEILPVTRLDQREFCSYDSRVARCMDLYQQAIRHGLREDWLTYVD